MVVLAVLALVWLGFRVVVVVLWVIRGLDPDSGDVVCVRDAVRPQDAVDVEDRPQDSVLTLQDAAATAVPVSLAGAVARWRKAFEASGPGSAPTSDPEAEWRDALRETISRTVPRPTTGPACLGGRDDDAYLRGWEDGADWISAGHDAEAPTWAGVAYMTGWNHAVRDVDRARRSATCWPTIDPGHSSAA